MAILGVETRHDAFLRELGGFIPNPTPFETGIPFLGAITLASST